jgi:hypothetical protein
LSAGRRHDSSVAGCSKASARSLRNIAARGRFDFHDGFVRFDLQERVTFGDTVTFLLSQGQELAGFLHHLENGHDNAEGHGCN